MYKLEVVLRLTGHFTPAVQVYPHFVARAQLGDDGQAAIVDHVLGGAQRQVELELVAQHGQEGIQRNGRQNGERKALFDGRQLAKHFFHLVNWLFVVVTDRCGMRP